MKDAFSRKAEKKREWSLSETAFQRFLSWLDEGADSGGERYLETRRRLVSYFDRKNCLAPDELADETMNRVARRLEEEGSITDTTPARYCYIVAKFVFLEHLRQIDRGRTSLDELAGRLPLTHTASSERNESQRNEERLACLEHCLQGLEPANREIIIQYYQGEQRAKIEHRRVLSDRLGLTINALSIRACRIRDRLEACVTNCLNR